MPNKLISIIIPVYDVEPYLRRCLDSVIQQTLSDIEIICINDCSPDNSLEILREYEAKDSRVKIINFSENKNAANARNAGLEIATGEYLGFVDPDDCIDLNFYEKLYRAAKSEKADIVKGQRQTIATDGKIFVGNLNNKIVEKNNKMVFTYEWQSAIFRASLVYGNHIKFPVECPKAQDIVFLTRCVVKAKKLILADGIYYHHKREGSLNDTKISPHSIESALHAKKLIFDELNRASGEEIDEGGYLYAYFVTLLTIITHTFFQNDSLECKRMCIQRFVEYYHKCKNNNAVDKKISETILGYVLPLIKKFNNEELLCELYKYSSADHLWRENLRIRKEILLKNLRNNVKKELSSSVQ